MSHDTLTEDCIGQAYPNSVHLGLALWHIFCEGGPSLLAVKFFPGQEFNQSTLPLLTLPCSQCRCVSPFTQHSWHASAPSENCCIGQFETGFVQHGRRSQLGLKWPYTTLLQRHLMALTGVFLVSPLVTLVSWVHHDSSLWFVCFVHAGFMYSVDSHWM